MAGWTTVLPVLAAILVTCQAYSEAGHYLVTAPRSATIGSPYTLTVQVYGTAGPVNISAYIEVYDGVNATTGVPFFVPVTPVVYRDMVQGSVERLTLQIPPQAIITRTTRLHVRGTGGLQIEESYSITFVNNMASIYLQTDKLHYLAGETVTIKAFALNKDLIPYSGQFHVFIQDSTGTRMDEWTSVAHGISTFTYTLDTHPAVGQWVVTGEGNMLDSKRLTFQVDQPPNPLQASKGTIKVKVVLPKTMNSSTPLLGSFTASYPMGVAVNGSAEVKLVGNGIRRQTIQFTGGAPFTFPMTDLTTENTRVTVTVTDPETGLTGVGQATVMVYQRDVKIQFTDKTSTVFRPQLPTTVYVLITNHADEPLHVPADSVYSTVYVYGVGHYQKTYDPAVFGDQVHSGSYPILARRLTLPDSGLIALDLDIPEDVTSVDLRVTFQGVQASLNLNRATHSPTDTYLQLRLQGTVPPVTQTQNADVHFVVVSNQPLSDLTVELVSRNRIVSAVRPTLSNVATEGQVHRAEVTVTVTWEMTPVTEVIAYQTVWVNRQNVLREVVSDSLILKVPGLLQNPVSVTSSSTQVLPGEEVTLTLQARPGSAVGVFVEEDNGASAQQLTPDKVAAFVAQNPPFKADAGDVVTLSGGEGLSAFSSVNLLWMDGTGRTYAQQAGQIQMSPYRPASTGNEEAFSMFLGTNVTGPDGRTTFRVRLPEDVRSWSVSGFAFDDAGRMGFVLQPLKIEAKYDVYAEVVGVDHLVYEEHAILEVYVHNTLTTDAQVTVTLRPVVNVNTVVFATDKSFQASATARQQTFLIAGKSSKQIFFTVTSPAGRYEGTKNARLEIDVVSGASKQTVLFVYTVVPPGVEQTYSESDLLSVNGHLTKDLTVEPPRRSLTGTDTRRVQVTESFTEQLLPLALQEEDVMEEGTGMAALVHLALPVMLARWRPELASQLQEPIQRGYQRLVSFTRGHPGIFRMCSRDAEIYSNWLNVAAMQYVAEANDHIYVDEAVPRATMYDYFSSSYFANVSHYFPELLFHPPVSGYLTIENNEALKAYTAIVIQDLTNHIDTSSRTWGFPEYFRVSDYEYTMRNLTDYLKKPATLRDPLSLSYRALGQMRFGLRDLANVSLTVLLSLQDTTDPGRDEIFWNTSSPNDTFNYFGTWHSGRHVVESRDIVTAANVLQVLVANGLQNEATKVARWLVRQRSANGFFKTAWDSVAAMEALLMYDNWPHPDHHGHQQQLQFETQWNRDSTSASVTATGHGTAYSLVEMKYYLTDDLGSQAYEVIPVVLDETLQHFKFMVCSRWLLADKQSGVTVQEVKFPSGFKVDASSGIQGQVGVLSYFQKSDNVLTVYYEKITFDSICYTLSVNRVHPVARSAPGYIVTSSFSHPELRDIVLYHARRLEQSSVCDLCTACCPLE